MSQAIISNRETVGPFLERYHQSHTCPGQAQHWFAYMGETDPLMGAAFGPIPDGLGAQACEFIAFARDPSYGYPASGFIAWCCSQLRATRLDLLITFCEPTYGPGIMFQAASWYYDGRRGRTNDGIRLHGARHPEGTHVYWKPLLRAGKAHAYRIGLQEREYPQA